MSSIRERQKDPYRALCKELIAVTLRDLRNSTKKGAARWLLGEKEGARLSIDTVREALDYPAPNRKAVMEAARTEREVIMKDDIDDEYVSAKSIRDRIGCSAGTVRAWWHRGDVEGCKARGPSVEHIMIRDDQRLQDRIEKYQNSRYGNA